MGSLIFPLFINKYLRRFYYVLGRSLVAEEASKNKIDKNQEKPHLEVDI